MKHIIPKMISNVKRIIVVKKRHHKLIIKIEEAKRGDQNLSKLSRMSPLQI